MAATTTTHMNSMNGMNTAMSVDDLVNSFGASSIGQEARDLAALQAQLAATLFASSQQPFASSSASAFGAPSSANANAFASTSRARTNSVSLAMPVQRGRSQQHQQQQQQHYQQPPQRCTTPLARTPSGSSFYDNSMDEDEQMVEDLLLPSPSPSTSSSSFSSYHHQPAPSSSSSSYQPAFPTTTSPSYPDYDAAEPDHDLFTTTDPFFLAQLQAQQAAEAARQERQERLRAGMMQGGGSAFMAPPSAFGAGMGMGMGVGAYGGGYASGGFATASAF